MTEIRKEFNLLDYWVFDIVSRESAHYKRTEYEEEEKEQEVDSRKQTT